jgi:hypothetical protein
MTPMLWGSSALVHVVTHYGYPALRALVLGNMYMNEVLDAAEVGSMTSCVVYFDG